MLFPSAVVAVLTRCLKAAKPGSLGAGREGRVRGGAGGGLREKGVEVEVVRKEKKGRQRRLDSLSLSLSLYSTTTDLALSAAARPWCRSS